MFVLFISATELSSIPGLSAAGANLDVLPYTAPADADMLYHDRPSVVRAAPVDPQGHPTPAIVTRAAVVEGGLPVAVVRAGTSIAPHVPFEDFGCVPSRDPRYGRSVPWADDIAAKSAALAKKLGEENRLLVLAESIPGGTTTALLLLRSLGYEGTVSSAGPVNPLPIKEQIWEGVCGRLGIGVGGLKGHGLEAAAEVGDAMQIAVASFVNALPDDVEVVLAGGTQMMSVAALVRDCGNTRPLLVATTKYVAQDKSASFDRYASDIGVDCYAAPLDFSKSKYQGLADYEKGFVKEGVGMGGAVWYATRKGVPIERIIQKTEELYEKTCAHAGSESFEH